MVERVQHRFTRLFPELRVMTYEARLKALKLWSLEERRNRADLIEVYKLMHGFTDIPVSTYFHIATDSCARGHTKKLVKSHCHTDARLLFLTACYQPLEPFVSRNSRCTISKCFQETLGITATEEDGLLHGLSVRINPSGCWLCKIRLSFVFVIWWLLLEQPHPMS